MLLANLSPVAVTSLETPYLSVQVDREGHFRVTDKRNGKVWATGVPMGRVEEVRRWVEQRRTPPEERAEERSLWNHL